MSPPKILISKKQKEDDETYRHRFDVASFVGKRLSADEKFDLINNLFTPEDSYSFLFFVFGTGIHAKKRSFKSSWLKQYPGLVYSPREDGAFCLPCVLFSTDIEARGQLVKEPVRNWRKATERFDEHFLHKRHNSGDISTTRKTGTGNKIHGDCVLRCDNILYYNYFNYITLEKIISKQSIFVSDRNTNMQFSKMQNKIYGSLVTIQYHTKCTNPIYPKFTSKKFSVYIFCCNFYLVIAYVSILTTDTCLHPFVSNRTQ